MKRGFTLLEVLLALALLGILGVMVFGSFSSLVQTVSSSEEAMDSLHQGEAVLEQLSNSLRSAAFVGEDAERFAFTHEDNSGDPPEDLFSWVSSSMAFLPPNYPTRQGLNRILVSVEEIDGVRGLAVSAYPYRLDPESGDLDDLEPWLVSTRVQGINLRVYDRNEDDWLDEWERTRQIPESIELSLYLRAEEGEEPKILQRRIDLPMGRTSRQARRGQ